MPPFKFSLPSFIQLTRSQKEAINNSDAILTTGVPGSGKTVVSIYRLLTNDKPTELITYTRMLKTAIAHSAMTKNIKYKNKVFSIHAWFKAKTKKNLINALENNEINNCLKNVTLNHLIIDEAQDMDIAFYKAIVAKSQSISIGADQDQSIYDVDTTEYALKQIFNNNIHIELGQNFRNRFEIFNFARQFVPESPRANDPNFLDRLQAENSGGDLPFLFVNNVESRRNDFINQILDNNRGKNIAILLYSTRRVDQYFTMVSNLGFEVSKYHNKLSEDEKKMAENDLKNIVVTTFHSSKGLEFDIVIMPSFEETLEEQNTLYYLGSTRAKDNLFIIAKNHPSILNKFDTNTYQS